MIKFENLPTVTMFVGLPRQGKTTIASHFVHQILHRKKLKHINVFSNVPIKGAFAFKWSDFGKYDFMSPSCLILDEAGIEVNNRNWSNNMDKDKTQFLKLLGHYKIKLLVFSQTWNDCDIQIRSMCSMLFIVKKSILPFFTVAIPVRRKIDVDNDTHEFKELYSRPGLLTGFFSTKRIFRPKYYKYFNSWDAPILKYKEFEVYK